MPVMLKTGFRHRGITDRRSMAGTAPTDSQVTRTLDAGPVHCSVLVIPLSFLACTSDPAAKAYRAVRRRRVIPAATEQREASRASEIGSGIFKVKESAVRPDPQVQV
jgi:hypothetical protein